MAANAAGHAEHFVARSKTRHAGPHGFDRAGKVDAENRRQLLFGMVRRPGMDFYIERVHAARGDANQNLTLARRRAGDCGETERPAMRLEKRRLHCGMFDHRNHS
jgi:hypothetical protein